MKALKIITIILAAASGLLLLGALAVTAFIFLPMRNLCNETVFSEAASPTGEYSLKHYEFGCGATTLDYEYVEVNGDIVFMVESHYAPYVVKWTGEQELSIGFSTSTPETSACTMLEKFKDVTIRYDDAVVVAATAGGKYKCP
jgi:hypothetical protein